MNFLNLNISILHYFFIILEYNIHDIKLFNIEVEL